MECCDLPECQDLLDVAWVGSCIECDSCSDCSVVCDEEDCTQACDEFVCDHILPSILHTPCDQVVCNHIVPSQSYEYESFDEFADFTLSLVTSPTKQDDFNPGLNQTLSTQELEAILMEDGSTSSMDPFHCHWEDCDLSFMHSLEFDNHLLVNHITTQDPVPNLKCAWEDCAQPLVTAPALLDHVKHSHVEETEHHKCRWQISSLETENEGEDAIGSTELCNACFPSVAELSEHITRNHVGKGLPSYICQWQNCTRHQKPFPQRQKILRHIQSHTGDRPYQCPLCPALFPNPGVLAQHLRTHTGEKPFTCSVCGKCFSASTGLSVHMRTHTGYKPLVCKFPGCGKRFSESSNLAKHNKTHLGPKDREFRCEIAMGGCGKVFGRADQLRRHFKSIHRPRSMDLRMQTFSPVMIQ